VRVRVISDIESRPTLQITLNPALSHEYVGEGERLNSRRSPRTALQVIRMSTATSKPNKVLAKMLDRLFAGLMNGPGMNCRPHASRQRADLTQLSRLNDVTPEE